jgi:hypothetical protein
MYKPILKAMPGDYSGLAKTSQSVYPLFVPHFLIQNPKNASDAVLLESYLYEVGRELAQIRGRGQFYVDIPRFKQEWRVTNDRHPLTFLHERIRGLGATGVVVIGLERDDEAFLGAAFDAAKLNNTGICIRVEKLDLEDPHNAYEILESRIRYSSQGVKQIDILIDCGDLQMQELSELRSRVLDFLSLIRNARSFRSLTLAGTTIPQKFSHFQRFQPQFLPRLELALWTSIRNAGYDFLDFGDYGVNNTRPIDRDKKIMNVLAKIRYSLPGAWLIVAGNVLKGNGADQYHRLAELVVDTPQFRISDLRWGHTQVRYRAKRTIAPGCPAEWVAIDLCNHIHYVCENSTEDAVAVASLAKDIIK